MRGVPAYVGENVCDIVSVGLIGKVELENIFGEGGESYIY